MNNDILPILNKGMDVKSPPDLFRTFQNCHTLRPEQLQTFPDSFLTPFEYVDKNRIFRR